MELTSLFAGNTSPKVAIASSGANIYKITTAGAISTLKTGLTAGTRWEWVQGPVVGSAGAYYGLNGTDTPQTWDGAAGATSNWVATSGAVPNGKFIVWHDNRAWVTGVSSDPSAVFFSDLLDPTSWPAANIVRFDSRDGQPVTGIGVVGPWLLVFKERKSWQIYDTSTAANRKIDDQVGCVSHRSIASSDAGTFFLSADQGVCQTQGTKIAQISQNVTPTINALSAGQRANAAGVVSGRHYYLSYSNTGSSNNRTLDFDMTLKSWWLHDLAANQWIVWEPGSTGYQLYGAKSGVSSPNGLVVQANVPGVFQDSAVNYLGGAYWRGPWLIYGTYIFRRFRPTPMLKKRMRQLFFQGSGKIVPGVWKNFQTAPYTSYPTTDFTSSQYTWGNSTTAWGGAASNQVWGGLSATGQARLFSLGVADAFSVEFGNTTSDPFEVDAYVTSIQFRKS